VAEAVPREELQQEATPESSRHEMEVQAIQTVLSRPQAYLAPRKDILNFRMPLQKIGYRT
jgi:hypothetical protein